MHTTMKMGLEECMFRIFKQKKTKKSLKIKTQFLDCKTNRDRGLVQKFDAFFLFFPLQ